MRRGADPDGVDFDILSEATAAAVRMAIERAATENLTGEYLEFGVYQGYSLLAAWRTLKSLGASEMRLVGFDSFRGLPRPTAIDDDGYHRQGMFSCSRSEVERRLSLAGLDLSRLSLVEGYFDTTLSAETRRQLALTWAPVVLVDCDFYESSRLVLDFVEPLLRPGSVVIFDDWNLFDGSPDCGQRRAFREFLGRSRAIATELFSISWHGQAFVVEDVGTARCPASSPR